MARKMDERKWSGGGGVWGCGVCVIFGFACFLSTFVGELYLKAENIIVYD